MSGNAPGSPATHFPAAGVSKCRGRFPESRLFRQLQNKTVVNFQRHAISGLRNYFYLIRNRRFARQFMSQHIAGNLQVFRGDYLTEVHPAGFILRVAGDEFADFVERRKIPDQVVV